MLTSTFLHLAGIGPKRERELWERGFTTWHDVVSKEGSQASALHTAAVRSLDAFQSRDFAWLASSLAPGEHWRALAPFSAEPNAMRWLALDIETTGLEPHFNQVTVVGVCGHATRFEPVALCTERADWTERLSDLLAASDVLITFNGKTFDIPFLRYHVRHLDRSLPAFHVDLRYLFSGLGYPGGLKKVQRRLGHYREGELDDVDGFMAVRLWHEHRRGHAHALNTLVRYCLEDVVVLLPMAAHGYRLACTRLGAPWPCPCTPSVSLDHLPYDPTLVRRLKRW